jgi:hypothetical protein
MMRNMFLSTVRAAESGPAPSYPTTDLQIELLFEDSLEDTSGNERDAAANGGESAFLSYGTGKVNKSLELPARSGTGINCSYTASGAFTISFWFKTPHDDQGVMVRMASTTDRRHQLQMWTKKLALYVWNGSSWKLIGETGDLTQDTWYHVITTYDGTSTHAIYVDNSLVGTDSHSPAGPFNNGTVPLGHNGSWGDRGGQACSYDQFRFYSRVLSSDERGQLYASGSGV